MQPSYHQPAYHPQVCGPRRLPRDPAHPAPVSSACVLAVRRVALLPALIATTVALAVLLWGTPTIGFGA